MITRSSLFGILAGAVAAPIVVRSGLLMPVSAPLIVAPPFVTGGGNTLLTCAEITREALRILHDKLQYVPMINREWAWFDDDEGPEDYLEAAA
jgi:hypothetical protein